MICEAWFPKRNIFGTVGMLGRRRIAGRIAESKDLGKRLNLPVSHEASKLRIAVSSEQFDAVGSHDSEKGSKGIFTFWRQSHGR